MELITEKPVKQFDTKAISYMQSIPHGMQERVDSLQE